VRAYIVGALVIALFQTTLIAEKPALIQPVSAVTVWTAFTWANSGWKESVVAKTVREKFDDQGQLQSSILLLGSDTVFERTTYEYANDRLVRTTTTDAQKNLLRFTTYHFKNTWIELKTCRQDGTIIEREAQTLDSDGCVVSSGLYSADKKLLLNRQYTKDSKGLPLSESGYTPDGNLVYRFAYSYDNFDENGNWTIRYDREEYGSGRGSPRYILRRTLQYPEDELE